MDIITVLKSVQQSDISGQPVDGRAHIFLVLLLAVKYCLLVKPVVTFSQYTQPIYRISHGICPHLY